MSEPQINVRFDGYKNPISTKVVVSETEKEISNSSAQLLLDSDEVLVGRRGLEIHNHSGSTIYYGYSSSVDNSSIQIPDGESRTLEIATSINPYVFQESGGNITITVIQYY